MSDAADNSDAAVAPPRLVIFDVNETLSDLRPLADAFARTGLSEGDVEPWFAGVLRDGFALTSVGVKPSFTEMASEGLRVRLAASGVGEADVGPAVDQVMRSFLSLRVHSDVVAGVRALRDKDVRLVTLSNGSATVADGLLARAGIRDAFEWLLSVDDAPAWKPQRDAYTYALARCGVEAAEALLVAVHPWDIDGAARAGLRTGWLNRHRVRYPAYFTAPDVAAFDLVELADAWG